MIPTPKFKMRRIALLPNIVTAFGLSCGLFVIFKISTLGSVGVRSEALWHVTALLLLAAFADLLDGAIARAMKAESDFGGTFDILADAISFGVAPAVIILKTLSLTPGTAESMWATVSAIVFSLCGVLRLVRFNVHALRAKDDSALLLQHHKHFTGLPIPAAAAAAISLNLFLSQPDYLIVGDLAASTKGVILSSALFLLGSCMVSRWKFPSIKTLEIRVASFRTVCLTALGAVCVLYGVLYFFPLMFLLFSWSYVFLAWTLALIRKWAGQRSKTLEEFEPEPEEEELDEHG